MENMSYEDKLEIANNYLMKKMGLNWDDLSDINSLHDVCDEDDIIDLCETRIKDIMG